MTEIKSNLLILKDVPVLFSNFDRDDEFGRSITIDATDKDVQSQIAEWVKTNKVGLITSGRNKNEDDYNAEPNFKEYNETIQYTIKLNKNNDPAFKSECGEATLKDVRYTARISLVAQAFKFDNKFGSGVSASIISIALTKKPEGTDGTAELELI